MDAESIIVWFFIVALIVLIVVSVIFAVTSKKKKSDLEPGPVKPPTYPVDPEPRSEPERGPEPEPGPEPKPETPPGSSQIVIYSYIAEGTHRLCPSCDGEVGTAARICPICGQEL